MKKVLIITYYWPPAGGPGVQRVLKFVKYLPDLGWQPIILTVKNPTAPARDKSLLKKISNKLIIAKTHTIEPFNFYRAFTGKKSVLISKDTTKASEKESYKEKISRFIRANFFIPDARCGWNPFMIFRGLSLIKKYKPDVIFSTAPPHSINIGAAILSKITKLPWISDFRDPWTMAYWNKDLPKSHLTKVIDHKLEKKCLQKASVITTVSPELKNSFSNLTKTKIQVIYNGFEKIKFNDIYKNDKKFQIIFFGNLTKFQNPLPLYNALTKLPENIKNSIEVVFIGKVFDEFKDKIRNRFNYISTIFYSYMCYKKLMNFSQTANILFFPLYKTNYSKGIVSAKLFDYLALRKPILLIGNTAGIAAKIIEKTDSGASFKPNEIDEIKQYIIKTFSTVPKMTYNEKLAPYITTNNLEKLVRIFQKEVV